MLFTTSREADLEPADPLHRPGACRRPRHAATCSPAPAQGPALSLPSMCSIDDLPDHVLERVFLLAGVRYG